jgi:hypothetical protein
MFPTVLYPLLTETPPNSRHHRLLNSRLDDVLPCQPKLPLVCTWSGFAYPFFNKTPGWSDFARMKPGRVV